MSVPKPRPRAGGSILTVALLLLAAACGSSATKGASAGSTSATNAGSAPTTSGTSGATPTSGAATASSVACTGAPIKLTAIATLTGPISFPSVSRDYNEGVKAALAAVNAECKGGRPIQVTVCDDKSDPNESTACGRKAKADG